MTPHLDAERKRIRRALAQCRTHPELLALITDARAKGITLTVAYRLTLGSTGSLEFNHVTNIRIDNRLFNQETTVR